MKSGMDEMLKIDEDAKEQMMNAFNGGLDANENQQKLAELHFEAWMRQLDSKVGDIFFHSFVSCYFFSSICAYIYMFQYQLLLYI